MKWPIGQLILTEKPCNLVHWNLSHQLRLNLTIFTIKASHKYVNFFIYHSFTPSYCGQKRILNDSPYKFSGHYSVFNFYPKGRYVVICRACLYSMDIKVEGEFTIFDRHCLFNSGRLDAKITGANILSILKYAFYPHTHYYLLRFHVAVRKLDKIIIWLNESRMFRYVAFDGPGFLSDTLHKSSNYITTTTFQILVFMGNPHGITNNSLVFASKPLSTSRTVITNENKNSLFHFPDDKCKKGLCILLVRTHLGYHVNITVISVKSKIINDYGCYYAGIVVGERFNSEYKQIKTTCESNNNSVGQSIYSYKSSLILVIFWYKRYSEINTSVIISQTKCKSVLIDLCWLHNLCLKREKLCHSYLHNVTRLSGVSLTFNADIMAFALNSEDCTVLQFLRMEMKQNIVYQTIYTDCHIGLILKYADDIVVRVSHNQTKYSFVETKLDFCDDNKSCLKHISEPLIPRVVATSKEVLRSDQEIKGEGLIELIRVNENRLTIGSSWIELAISSNNYSILKRNLARFAGDFRLNKTYFYLGTKLPLSHTAFTIILLKSNTKVFDPHISLTVDIFATTFYNKEEICE